jgi:alpha-amylase
MANGCRLKAKNSYLSNKLFPMKLSALLSLTLLLFFTACKNKPTQTEAAAGDSTNTPATVTYSSPAWIQQSNIYEVNVRQYTKEGTFNAFAASLPRLKEMGVDILWFMPINPIGKKDRKGPLGSYYAVSDYTAVNPEFGTMDDWKSLVRSAHDNGFRVIIDWVPNHTAADHGWLTRHPDFYVKDSAGNFVIPYDWTDVRKLNFANAEMRDSMIAAMKFWITNTGIDGFRCDHAKGPGEEFWKKCNAILKKEKDVLMLAESEEDWLYRAGFDMSYAWKVFHTTVDVAAGRRPATAIDSTLRSVDSSFNNKEAFLYFTSNHDENSWNKADYGTMPGAKHAPFAVFSQTMKGAVPLIYSGQEEPVLRPVEFFKKDPIAFGKYKRAKFYKTLLQLRKSNPALSADASFRKVKAGDEKAVYAYVREKGNRKVLVVLNLSAKEQTIKIEDAPLAGEPMNVFMYMKEKVDPANSFKVEPWGYVVYDYQ